MPSKVAPFSRLLFVFAAIGALVAINCVNAERKCVWAAGLIECKNNPEKHADITVHLYDRDGVGLLQNLDRDDMMAVTVTEADGSFHLNGCGDDTDWLLHMHRNTPEPYVSFTHSCSGYKQEWRSPVKKIFAPNSWDLGTISL